MLNDLEFKILRDKLRDYVSRGLVSPSDYQEIMSGWNQTEDWVDVKTASIEVNRAKITLLDRVTLGDPRFVYLRSEQSTWVYRPSLRIIWGVKENKS